MTVRRDKMPDGAATQTVDPRQALVAIAASLTEVREALNRHPFLSRDGRYWRDKTGAPLVIGNNTIPHGLGRRPRGWLILRATAAAPVLYEVSSTDLVLVLNSATATVPELWIF